MRAGPETMAPIRLYRELLDQDLERWQAETPALRQRLSERRALFGGREILKVLRPKFIGSGEYAYLDYVSGVSVGAMRRLALRALDDPALQEFLRVTEGERRLLEPEPLCPDPMAFTRLDSFLTADGPRFVELNGECPAGPGFSDVTLQGMLELPLVQEFSRRTGAFPITTSPGVLRGLLMAWRASGKRGMPSVLITDYLDLPTVNEFHILADHFNAEGVPTVVEDPRNLDYRDGKLWAQGREITLVYRRVLTNEFLEREDQVKPLFEAYRDGAVVMVNPFRAKLGHKKSVFAILRGDHLGTEWLTREEKAVIERHVPWTRQVREIKTDHDGREVDLLPYLVENRERFVLKPSDDYGGKGITIGWEADAEQFERALAEALEGDYVAQERIVTEEEPFPVMEDGLSDQDMIVDLDPYVYFGRVHGLLARLAAGALCNVSSGGGQVPVLFLPSP